MESNQSSIVGGGGFAQQQDVCAQICVHLASFVSCHGAVSNAMSRHYESGNLNYMSSYRLVFKSSILRCHVICLYEFSGWANAIVLST